MVRLCVHRDVCNEYDGGKSCIMSMGCGLRSNYETQTPITLASGPIR